MSDAAPQKRVVAYFPDGRQVELDELPLTWLWDAYPLAPDSWGNVRAFYDGLGRDRLIRKWIDRLQPIANSAPLYRPADAPLPPGFADGGARRCYRPTKEDIERVRRLFPAHPCPEAPPWNDIAMRLVLAGHKQTELAVTYAPLLLVLLEQSLADKQGESEADSVFRDVTLAARVVVGGKLTQGLSRVIEIARGSAPVNQKLTAIGRIGLLRPDVSARELAELLEVSDTAIKKTQWWRNRMAKRRQAKADSEAPYYLKRKPRRGYR